MKEQLRFSFWVITLILLFIFITSLVSLPQFSSQPIQPTLAATAVSVTLPTASPTQRPTLPATYTPRPGIPPTVPPADPVTTTPTVTQLSSPTTTPPPSFTPSPSFTPAPTLTSLTFAPFDPNLPTPATAIPTPAPLLAKANEITNIVLLGNDVSAREGGRTDSIIIVSINRELKTATMLSLPRDLYVYVPGWTMARINLALPHGHGSNYPGGGGALIKDTILYNFGIEIDYYARIGFDGFQQVVDALGGVEVVVNCQLGDWRLKSPELDQTIEENWEMYTLEPGVYDMDGDLALWYARSRRTTNDFERGRRQQQLLRAIFRRALAIDVIPQIPALWDTYREVVETDLTLPVILQLAAVAPGVGDNGLQHLYLAGEAVNGWREPNTGAALQVMNWQEAAPIFAQLMQPPALNESGREAMTVEVISNSNLTFRLVAQNLAWHGFIPTHTATSDPTPDHTQVYYFGSSFKASFNWLMAWIFDIDRDEIQLTSHSESSPYDYRVIPGYDYDSCRPELEAPLIGNDE